MGEWMIGSFWGFKETVPSIINDSDDVRYQDKKHHLKWMKFAYIKMQTGSFNCLLLEFGVGTS